EESRAVLQYVADGGVLVGDTMPGYFDEHHRTRNAIAQSAAIEVARHDVARRIRLDIGATAVTAITQHALTAPAARALARDADGVPRAYLQQHGDGTMLLLPFELGSLQPGRPRAPDDDGGSGTWFASLLQQAGLRPAYRAHASDGGDAGTHLLRVEQPYVDDVGNLALVVATRGRTQAEPVPAGTIDVTLPGTWHRAWWASAEDSALQPLAISPLDGGRHRIELPEVTSAGIVYLFRQHAPLLGFGPIATDAGAAEARAPAADGHHVRMRADEAFTLPIQLVNASEHALESGELRIDAPSGWTVVPAMFDVPRLAAGAMHTQRVTVTPLDARQHGARDAFHHPQPMTARWSDGRGRDATMSMLVDFAPDPAQRSLLLSGNASWSSHYPHRLDAHVSYRHLAPDDDAIDDPASLKGTRGALLNGFGSAGGERNSSNRGTPVTSHYVRYRAREAEILFDLRTTRHIARVHVVNGPEHVTPLSVETYTSVDGKHFAHNATVKSSTPALENVIALHQIEARYVKLRVTWPDVGGTLDEVEIWGR
ncbi:MAG TPA: NEW3 domain-containing protein, partial [Pseudomonadales bacterium]